MSELGQKRKCRHFHVMSASPRKADISCRYRDVRLVPKGDNLTNVAQENGRSSSVSLLLAAIEPGKAYPRPAASSSAFIHTGLTRARGSMFTHFTPADLVAILNIPRLQTLPNSFKILREYRLSVVALVFSR